MMGHSPDSFSKKMEKSEVDHVAKQPSEIRSLEERRHALVPFAVDADYLGVGSRGQIVPNAPNPASVESIANRYDLVSFKLELLSYFEDFV